MSVQTTQKLLVIASLAICFACSPKKTDEAKVKETNTETVAKTVAQHQRQRLQRPRLIRRKHRVLQSQLVQVSTLLKFPT